MRPTHESTAPQRHTIGTSCPVAPRVSMHGQESKRHNDGTATITITNNDDDDDDDNDDDDGDDDDIDNENNDEVGSFSAVV